MFPYDITERQGGQILIVVWKLQPVRRKGVSSPAGEQVFRGSRSVLVETKSRKRKKHETHACLTATKGHAWLCPQAWLGQ